MESIIFSPVGSTDPYRGGYQGPLLHIIYKYRPSKVVLLLTHEMTERESLDNRYSLSVNKTAELMGYYIDLKLINSTVEDPSDFDSFLIECRNIIHKIKGQNTNSQILLNITSGTPQMNSTLCILASTSSIDLKCIQVKTPEKKSNIKVPFIDSFDIDEIENLMDYLPESENRCREPDILSYRNSFVHEKVKGLIQSLDYTGALNLASIYPGAFSSQAMAFLRHLDKRSKWDINGADKEVANINMPNFQLYAANNIKAKNISEYFLCMVVKYKRNELADMILRISPLLTALCEDFIRDNLKFNLDLITERTYDPVRITRRKLTANTSLLSYLDNEYSGCFKDTPISFYLLLNITKYLLQAANKAGTYSILIESLEKLREVESKVRNVTAHQIEYINDEYIRQATGLSSRSILNKLKSVMKSVYGNYLAPDFMEKYDALNIVIIGMIE